MPWLKTVPKPHSCNFPYAEVNNSEGKIWLGSIWQCPECELNYRLSANEYGDKYFARIGAWRLKRALR